MRKLSILAAGAAALMALTAGAADAKGRHYHTVVSTHHITLQACVDARSVMYLRYDARHAKASALVSYRAGLPGQPTGSGRFGAFEGGRHTAGGASVSGVVRFRVKVDHVKRAAVKTLPVPRIGAC